LAVVAVIGAFPNTVVIPTTSTSGPRNTMEKGDGVVHAGIHVHEDLHLRLPMKG